MVAVHTFLVCLCVIRGRMDRKRFGAFGTEAFFAVWVQSDSGRFRLPVRESNVIL